MAAWCRPSRWRRHETPGLTLIAGTGFAIPGKVAAPAPSGAFLRFTRMRFDGTLVTWNDDRGFGYIEPTQGGERVFVHVSAWPKGAGRPQVNQS